MAKKKRKRKVVHRQKPLTARALKEKVDTFFEEILELCGLVGSREVVEQLPYNEVVRLYQIRIRDLKLKLMEPLKPPPGLLKSLRTLMNDSILDIGTFTLPGNPTDIPFRKYFTHILTLLFWLRMTDPEAIPNYNLLKKKLQPIIDYCDGKENPEEELKLFLDVLGCHLSGNPFRSTYYFQWKPHSPSNRHLLDIHLILRGARSVKRAVRLDGANRLVFLASCWDRGAHQRLQVKANKLSKNTALRGTKLDLYIQKHALGRLKERLDLFIETDLFYYIGSSVKKGHLLRHKEGRALLGYYIEKTLLGYLVIEMTEGIAVIRTFLFLTNDGTPQGNKLTSKLGINKLDKAYTGLDKLSTFIHGDLKDNEKLCEILKEAGCEKLLTLDAKALGLKEREKVLQIASTLRKYLELEEDQE